MKRQGRAAQSEQSMSGSGTIGRLAGHFDGLDGARAVGWAADLGAPGRTLAVEFVAVAPDGEAVVLGRTEADRPRADLAGIGLTQTDHGFAWTLPRLAFGCRLLVRLADGGAELPGSPVQVPRKLPPRFAGHLDRATAACALGWAADLNAPAAVVEVEFFAVASGGETTVL